MRIAGSLSAPSDAEGWREGGGVPCGNRVYIQVSSPLLYRVSSVKDTETRDSRIGELFKCVRHLVGNVSLDKRTSM